MAAQRAPTAFSDEVGCPENGSIFNRWRSLDLLVMFGLVVSRTFCYSDGKITERHCIERGSLRR
jgi:hypothetical protein